MTPYQLLKLRLDRNVYKRGQYKGDAPLEKRKKSHVRIVEGENMYVRMYRTDILTAFRNGEVKICLGGWSDSSTTKQWLNYALGVVGFHGFWLGSRSIMSMSQLTIKTPHGTYLYYDGIRFNQAGELVSTPQPFEAKRIDKAESKGFTDNLKVSGFKDMYPLLYATCTPPEGGRTIERFWKDYIQDADHADVWPSIIEFFKYDTRWDRTIGKRGWVELDDAQSCWARMMAKAKQDMYTTIRTEVTRLDK
jgi:hypothetical protein